MGICHSYTPDGRCVSLLKILLTNYCIYDCLYCVNRVRATCRAPASPSTRSSTSRSSSTAATTSRGCSSVPASSRRRTTRWSSWSRSRASCAKTHHFGGYIHLKAMPGRVAALLAEAGRYADRVSANIELPTPADLRAARAGQVARPRSPRRWAQLRARIDEARRARRASRKAPAFAPAGQSTQMIVGATPTTDAAILQTASRSTASIGCGACTTRRSAPSRDAIGGCPPSPPPLVREHRLYQADWLMRFYGFDVGRADHARGAEPRSGNRSEDWPGRCGIRDMFPVDVNVAARELLLRVPGLGQRSVERILAIAAAAPPDARRSADTRIRLAWHVRSSSRPTGGLAATQRRHRLKPNRGPAVPLDRLTCRVSCSTAECATWHRAARDLLERDQPPAAVECGRCHASSSPRSSGFTAAPAPGRSTSGAVIPVPRAFVVQAKLAACHGIRAAGNCSTGSCGGSRMASAGCWRTRPTRRSAD